MISSRVYHLREKRQKDLSMGTKASEVRAPLPVQAAKCRIGAGGVQRRNRVGITELFSQRPLRWATSANGHDFPERQEMSLVRPGMVS